MGLYGKMIRYGFSKRETSHSGTSLHGWPGGGKGKWPYGGHSAPS